MVWVNRPDTHEFYTETPRHWCAYSESYTGADSLLTFINRGWQIVGTVYREDVLHRGARRSAVYHIKLEYHHDNQFEYTLMTVVSNPFLLRYFRQRAIEVAQLQKKAKQKQNIIAIQDIIDEEDTQLA